MSKENVREYKKLLKEFGKNFLYQFKKARQTPVSCSNHILVCGMGGSAISGNYLQTILSYYTDCEVIVSKGYEPPNYIDNQWTIFAISYSGNTEETISQTRNLLNRNLKPVVISSGGNLRKIAEENNLTFFEVETGLQPRAALPQMFGLLLGAIFDSFSLPFEVEVLISEVEDQIGALNSQEPFLKTLASNLISKVIFVLSSDLLGSVGLRFRCQLNENSKLHAANFDLPEFSHNGIIGFDGIGVDVFFILLRTDIEHPRTKLHLDFIEEKFKENLISFEAEGNSLLAQMLSLTVFLDYLSILIAEIQGIDPYAITSINHLKSVLRSS